MIPTEISSGSQENMGKLSVHVTCEKIINLLNVMGSRSGQITSSWLSPNSCIRRSIFKLNNVISKPRREKNSHKTDYSIWVLYLCYCQNQPAAWALPSLKSLIPIIVKWKTGSHKTEWSLLEKTSLGGPVNQHTHCMTSFTYIQFFFITLCRNWSNALAQIHHRLFQTGSHGKVTSRAHVHLG